MKRADRRGWGPGWPHDNSAKMVQVKAKISGVTWLMDYRVAPIKQFVVDQIEALGHLYDYGPKDVNDDWGFVNRPIRGTREPSNHSWGLATDDDATEYPQGQTKRRPPQWIIDLHKKYGFINGVYWSNPDPMHFEFEGTVADAEFFVNSLAAHAITITQPPLPPSAPIPPPSFISTELMVQEDTNMLIELAYSNRTEYWLELDHPQISNAAQHVCIDGDTITPGEYKVAYGFRRIDGNRFCDVWRAGHNEVKFGEWKVAGR